MFFFVVAPFCSCPASLVSRIFLLSAPGVQSVFFFVALRRAPRPLSAGPEPKKKHHPGCFFFALAPGKGRGRRSPLGRRHGAKAKKKKTPRRVFFFCCVPARMLTHSLRAWVAMPRPGGATAKKKKHPGWCVFFCCGPTRILTHSLRAWVAMPRPGGATAKKKPWMVFFFFFAAAPPGLFR